MKRIAIAGAGEIGAFLAERMVTENYDVTVIDRNAEALSALQNHLDVASFQGNATNLDDLVRADIAEADLFIATTRQDETNLVACLLSREIQIPHNIAVTRYLGSRDKKIGMGNLPTGIDMIVNTSEVMNNGIMEVIETIGPSEVATFADGRIILMGYRIGEGSDLIGQAVSAISGNGHERSFYVATLVRGDELIAPSPDTLLREEDYLYLVATQEHLPQMNAALHVETIKTRTAVIYGDNYLSQLLAASLLYRQFHVTMLAATDVKARFLKDYFKGRSHFHVEVGEGIEAGLQRRVKVPTTSVFIAAKSDDASNLTACLVAKHLGVAKTVATIKREDILSLCPQGGVDANFAPRLATAEVIQKVMHEDRVLDVRAVARMNLEVMALEAGPSCRCTRTTIGKLKLPPGVFVGGIVSGGVAHLPSPTDRIRPGDTAIVLTRPEHLAEVEKVFHG